MSGEQTPAEVEAACVAAYGENGRLVAALDQIKTRPGNPDATQVVCLGIWQADLLGGVDRYRIFSKLHDAEVWLQRCADDHDKAMGESVCFGTYIDGRFEIGIEDEDGEICECGRIEQMIVDIAAGQDWL